MANVLFSVVGYTFPWDVSLIDFLTVQIVVSPCMWKKYFLATLCQSKYDFINILPLEFHNKFYFYNHNRFL